MGLRLKENDVVSVIAGNSKGNRGPIKNINRSKGRVTISGVNIRKKHVKPSADNPQGGRVDMEGSIAESAVMPWCESCEKPVRIRIKKLEDDKKVRVCAKCGAEYGEKY